MDAETEQIVGALRDRSMPGDRQYDATGCYSESVPDTLCHQAATAIETLASERDAALARVAVLKESATRFAQYEGHHLYCGHAPDYIKPCVCGFNAASDKLRKALGASHDA